MSVFDPTTCRMPVSGRVGRPLLPLVLFGIAVCLDLPGRSNSAAASDDLSQVVGQLDAGDKAKCLIALRFLQESAPDSAIAAPAVVRLLSSPHLSVRWEALSYFETLGPRARRALPELVNLQTEAWLGRTYAGLGSSAVDAVAGRLDSSLIRAEITDRYGGPAWEWSDPEAQVGVWILQDGHWIPDSYIRTRLVGWIGERPATVGAQHDDSRIARLLEDLGHDNADVRWTALRGLEVALPAEEFRMRVAPAALDPDPRVRSRVMDSLWDAGPDGERAAALAYAIYHRLSPAHIVELWTPCEGLHAEIVGAVFEPQLDASFESMDRRHRFSVCVALGEVTQLHEDQMAFLCRSVCDRDPAVRLAAERAIVHHDLESLLNEVVITPYLTSDDPVWNAAALRGLPHSPGLVKEYAPQLMQIITRRHSTPLRAAAILALARHPDPTSEMVAAIDGLLSDEDSTEVHSECIYALGRFGPRARNSTGLLVEQLNQPGLRHRALDALDRLFPDNRSIHAATDRLRTGFDLADAAGSLESVMETQRQLLEATLDERIRQLVGEGD